jgi:hypothetical protein
MTLQYSIYRGEELSRNKSLLDTLYTVYYFCFEPDFFDGVKLERPIT